MNSSTSGWLVLTRNFVAGSHPQNDKFTRVKGRNNIPRREERVLFISNHTTMYDSFLIAVAAYFPQNIFYLLRAAVPS